MFKKIALASTLVLSLASVALADPSSDHVVTDVDVDGTTVYIWTDRVLETSPSCAKADWKRAATCKLSDAYCKEAMSLALAAMLSGRHADIFLTGECGGSFATFNRFRVGQ